MVGNAYFQAFKLHDKGLGLSQTVLAAGLKPCCVLFSSRLKVVLRNGAKMAQASEIELNPTSPCSPRILRGRASMTKKES